MNPGLQVRPRLSPPLLPPTATSHTCHDVNMSEVLEMPLKTTEGCLHACCGGPGKSPRRRTGDGVRVVQLNSAYQYTERGKMPVCGASERYSNRASVCARVNIQPLGRWRARLPMPAGPHATAKAATSNVRKPHAKLQSTSSPLKNTFFGKQTVSLCAKIKSAIPHYVFHLIPCMVGQLALDRSSNGAVRPLPQTNTF